MTTGRPRMFPRVRPSRGVLGAQVTIDKIGVSPTPQISGTAISARQPLLEIIFTSGVPISFQRSPCPIKKVKLFAWKQKYSCTQKYFWMKEKNNGISKTVIYHFYLYHYVESPSNVSKLYPRTVLTVTTGAIFAILPRLTNVLVVPQGFFYV